MEVVFVIIAIIGAAIGSVFAYAWARLGEKASRSRIEMWRIGAEGGASNVDRQNAQRLLGREQSRTRWMMPVLETWFTVIGAVLGAGFALGLGHAAGVLR